MCSETTLLTTAVYLGEANRAESSAAVKILQFGISVCEPFITLCG